MQTMKQFCIYIFIRLIALVFLVYFKTFGKKAFMKEIFQSASPSSIDEFMNKFVYDPKLINIESLRNIFGKCSVTQFVNVNKIYLLTASDLLKQTGIDIKEFNASGLYHFGTGNIYIHLESHDFDTRLTCNGASDHSLINTLFHELRHAMQKNLDSPLFKSFMYSAVYEKIFKKTLPRELDTTELDADSFAEESVKNARSLIRNVANWEYIRYVQRMKDIA